MAFVILVTGGRGFTRWNVLNKALLEYVNERDIVIRHGANPHGADAMAKRWAKYQGVVEDPHPADWTRYGRKAGGIRNQEMVDLGADVVTAFPDPNSIGTWDCVDRAEAAGLNVRIWNPITGEELP